MTRPPVGRPTASRRAGPWSRTREAGRRAERSDGGGVRFRGARSGNAGSQGARRATAPAAGAAALLLVAACAGEGPREPADAEARDDPPRAAPPVPAADVPPTLEAPAAWAAPFSAPPKASGDGFVGLVMPEESGGDLRFLGVGADGTTRWSLFRNPSCTAFAATRDADGGDLVVVLDSDAAPDAAADGGGGLATRTTAAAYRPDTGTLAWGPVDVPGTLVGPGLVFGASAGSVMSAETGPKAALDPSTGEVVANESEESGAEDSSAEDGGAVAGGAVLHEHHGALLTERDGRLRAVDTATGDELWSGQDVTPPEHAPDAVPVPGPRPETDASAAAVLAWHTDAGGAHGGEADAGDGAETVGYTVHDLRTGRRLAEFGADEEPRLIGTPEGQAVASGARPDGAGILVGLEAGTDEPRRLWQRPRAAAERPEAIVGGVLYLSTGNPSAEGASGGPSGAEESGTRAADMRDGSGLGTGAWAAPVAAAPDGTALLPIASDGLGDAFAALPSA